MREMNIDEINAVSGAIVSEGCWDELAGYVGATVSVVMAAPSVGGLLFTGALWGLAAYQLDACRAPVNTVVDQYGCHRVGS